MEPILECKNLSFSYKDHSVLSNFNLTLKKGERVSVLGASGSGKTSLLRLCAGLEKPTGGEVYLRGELVASADKFVPPGKRNIGYVFQNLALFEKTKVKHNIYYGCKTEADYKEAEILIEKMNLTRHLSKFPGQLSGGERQKVALARTLALQPRIVFMDEPFSSIDGDQTSWLINEVCEVFAELGVTALLVTHSKEESEQFSTRIVRF